MGKFITYTFFNNIMDLNPNLFKIYSGNEKKLNLCLTELSLYFLLLLKLKLKSCFVNYTNI